MSNSIHSNYSGLTSNKILAKNTLYSMVAKVLPLIAGIAVLPYLISELGEYNFGILAIIWLIIGYFSMFDLGIGRAAIKQISDLIGKNEFELIPSAAWTGIITISGMGLIAGLILFFGGELILEKGFQNTSLIANEALFYTSFAVPFIVATTGFKAILMAEQKFLAISAIQSLNSLLNYILPLILLVFFNAEFIDIIFALLLLKVAAFLSFAVSGLVSEPRLREGIQFKMEFFKVMIHFGKWVTISNIIGPMIGQLDRYFIAAFISVTAVTFYTTPLEVLSKVLLLPMALISVLFPAFSALSSRSYKQREQLFIDACKSVIVIVFPVLLCLSLFAGFGLEIWLGEEFRSKSTFVSRVFCVVFLMRSIALIPATYLPGMNRPDIPAKFHVIEIVIFTAILYLTAKTGDIDFVAYASLLITFLDTVLLLWSSYKLMELKQRIIKEILVPLILVVLTLFSLLFVKDIQTSITIGLISITIFVAYFFSFVKEIMIRLLKAFRPLGNQ